MHRLTLRYFQFAIPVVLLVAVFATMTAAYAHAALPHLVKVRSFFAVPKTATIKINTLGAVIFSPAQLSCYEQLPCLDITNTTGLTFGLYLNGKLLFDMPPGDIAESTFVNLGINSFTIPSANPAMQLMVTVKPYTTPNTNLKVNAYGKIIFSPQKLSCPFYGTCISITNTTKRTLSVYLDGTQSFTIYPR